RDLRPPGGGEALYSVGRRLPGAGCAYSAACDREEAACRLHHVFRLGRAPRGRPKKVEKNDGSVTLENRGTTSAYFLAQPRSGLLCAPNAQQTPLSGAFY